MTYTVRYAHLEHLPCVGVGDKITRGMKVGRMGNTGASRGAHLHIDCVHGEQHDVWKLEDAEKNDPAPAFRQLQYFRDSELFQIPVMVTTPICDYNYFKDYNKIHTAYDLIPSDGWKSSEHFDIFWNRSKVGTVIAEGFDSAYGNYLHIKFAA